MIAIDTNILIRFIVEDDEIQAAKVEKLFKKHNRVGEIYISNICLVETEWVLSSGYKFGKAKVHKALDIIFNTSQFIFEDKEALVTANNKWFKSNLDFSDCLIGELGKKRNVKTYTFDKKLKRDANFVALK